MSLRAPLVSPSSPLRQPTEINEIAKSPAFRRVFQTYCHADVLPLERTTFKRSEAPLYIADRLLPEGERHGSTPEYYFEAQLDKNFWDHNEVRRIVFIEGGRGTGKSTLTDFYLRCYCPTISSKRDHFNEKLTIQVNAGSIKTPELFRDKFFPRMAQAILKRCRERNNFPINEAVRSYTSEMTGDKSASPRPDKQPKEWCEAALFALSRKIETKDPYMPFKYLVLAIDNLDQTTLSVQTIVIDYITDWINRSFGFMLWRVYLPMWPETVRALLDANAERHLKQLSDTIRLGEIPKGRVVGSRNRELFEFIRHKSAIPQIESSADYQRCFDQGKITCDECSRYVTETNRYYHETFDEFLVDLTHGDLRKQLEIRDNALSSRTAFHLWAHHRSNRLRSFIPYDVLDSVLTGKASCYDPRNAQISNLYSYSRRSTLLGWHLVNLLLGHESITLRDFTVYLSALGYSDSEIQIAHDTAFDANMFHHLAGQVQNTDLIVHTKCAQRYMELLVEPAYVDNVTMITPVPPEVLSKLHVSSTLRVSDTKSRVDSTIAFINLIWQDDVRFNDTLLKRYRELSANPEANERFRSRLELATRLPQVWKRVAGRYVERLQKLKEYFDKNPAKDSGMTDDWWRQAIGDNVFREARTATDDWPFPWEQ